MTMTTAAAIPAELAEIHASAISIEVLPDGSFRMNYGTHIELWPAAAQLEAMYEHVAAVLVQAVLDHRETSA